MLKLINAICVKLTYKNLVAKKQSCLAFWLLALMQQKGRSKINLKNGGHIQSFKDKLPNQIKSIF